MRRRTVWILLAGIAVGIMLRGSFRRPAPEPDDTQVLDGAGTYVDNDALWRTISGDWVSADGRWTLKLADEDRMTLLRDGETAAESALSFAYLCPEPARETELSPEAPQLRGDAGQIVSLIHEAGANGGVLTLKLLRPDGAAETVTFQKSE